jgi:hypothetical protein
VALTYYQQFFIALFLIKTGKLGATIKKYLQSNPIMLPPTRADIKKSSEKRFPYITLS